jgi:hypothetical protein
MLFRKKTLTENVKSLAHTIMYEEVPDETPTTTQFAAQTRKQLHEQLGKQLSDQEINIYLAAWDRLTQPGWLPYCKELVERYHSGDEKLTATLLRGALRPSYSSTSALLHFACTGVSGSGKNDLIANLAAMLPTERLVLFSSITPTVLYYSLREGERGNYTMNPDKYRNKLIVVTEIADSTGWTALKAFAELDENTDFVHSTTIGSKNADLTVRGPRGVWITSVHAVGDEQVHRRFIHSEIETENDETRANKVKVVTDNLLSQGSINSDPRAAIVRAGFQLLYSSEPKFEPVSPQTTELIRGLMTALGEKGYSVTQLKQLYSLAECAAVEKQFWRGACRIVKEDVLEAWYLIGFEDDHEIEVGGGWLRPLDPLRVK